MGWESIIIIIIIIIITIISKKQEIRSVEHGYLSHCFKNRTRDLGHSPFGVIHRPLSYVVLAMAYPTKKNEESSFIRLNVMESEVPKFKK